MAPNLVDIPQAQPGFDALNKAAPVIMQINPQGKWEKSAPTDDNEKELQKIVEHLMKTKAMSAVQSYCTQCAQENDRLSGKSNYVPIILMPLNEVDECPFDDIECEKENAKNKKPDTKNKQQTEGSTENAAGGVQKVKKRPFVLQRFTDFDLLSQW